MLISLVRTALMTPVQARYKPNNNFIQQFLLEGWLPMMQKVWAKILFSTPPKLPPLLQNMENSKTSSGVCLLPLNPQNTILGHIFCEKGLGPNLATMGSQTTIAHDRSCLPYQLLCRWFCSDLRKEFSY